MALSHLTPMRRAALARTANAVLAAGPPAPPPPPDPGRGTTVGDLITPAMAGDRLGVSAKVLERWRGAGAGPAFVRLTSKTIRYRAVDIDAFVAGRTMASTASA